MLLKVYENGKARLKADQEELRDLLKVAMVGIQHEKTTASRTHLEALSGLEAEVLSMAEEVSDWWRSRKPEAAEAEFASDLRRIRDAAANEARRRQDACDA